MKLGGWIIMLTVLIMILNIIGLGTGMLSILDSLGVNLSTGSADIEHSSFWIYFLGILTVISGGTIVIGLFGKGYDVSLAILPWIIFVGVMFISTFWGIMSMPELNEWWLKTTVVVVFVGLAIGFISSCLDYFAGR